MSLEDQAAEETSSDTLLDSATPELQEGEYFLSEGIKGTGEAPEWYNGSKYSSVAEQAKGYSELEKKFGGFTGAPKDGYSAPEGIESDDALLSELQEFATKNNMSQDTFSEAWELLSAQAGAVEEVSQEQEMAKLGDNAQQRINTVDGFLRNNLDAAAYEEVSRKVTNADAIELIEAIVSATAPAKLPIDGGEHPAGLTWSDIETEMFKKNERGQMLRSVDPSHEAKIQKMLQEFGGDKPYQKMVG
tara:strand:- start:5470 stop:6207 length:738 start_codon:yes stop_codon:yes gene_type:complete